MEDIRGKSYDEIIKSWEEKPYIGDDADAFSITNVGGEDDAVVPAGGMSYASVVGDGPDKGVSPKDQLDALREGVTVDADDTSAGSKVDEAVAVGGAESGLDADATTEDATPMTLEIKPEEHFAAEEEEAQDSMASESKEEHQSDVQTNGTDMLEEDYKHPDGHSLFSTKMPGAYQIGLHLDDTEVKRTKTDKDTKSQLVTGKEAGAGWHKSSIRFAPLNVPLQRRLQTMMVLAHGLSIAALLSLFFVLCAIPMLWPVLLPYVVYCLFSNASSSGELSHRSERMRRSRVWSLFASYYPARLHRSKELSPYRK